MIDDEGVAVLVDARHAAARADHPAHLGERRRRPGYVDEDGLRHGSVHGGVAEGDRLGRAGLDRRLREPSLGEALTGEPGEHGLWLEAEGPAGGPDGSRQLRKGDAGPAANLDHGIAGREPGRGDEIRSELDLAGIGRSKLQDVRPLLRCGVVPAFDGEEGIGGTWIHQAKLSGGASGGGGGAAGRRGWP